MVLLFYLIPAIVTLVPVTAWLNNGHVQTSPRPMTFFNALPPSLNVRTQISIDSGAGADRRTFFALTSPCRLLDRPFSLHNCIITRGSTPISWAVAGLHRSIGFKTHCDLCLLSSRSCLPFHCQCCTVCMGLCSKI